MNFEKPSQRQLDDLVPGGLILLGYRGSVTHGTWEPEGSEFSTDDIDLMGVAIGPLEHYFGLKTFLSNRGVYERFIGEYDVVTYELRKFVSLLCNANPNVLSLLWMKPDMYPVHTRIGDMLIGQRDLFSSKKVYHSFTGYAHGQIKKMTANACEGYMGEKRKTLVERFGFDTKNAAHAIRLLRMGIEFLRNGEFEVDRRDYKELLAIKHGEWSLERVKSEAESLFAEAEVAYRKSTLPEDVDMGAVNRLLVHMVTQFYSIP